MIILLAMYLCLSATILCFVTAAYKQYYGYISFFRCDCKLLTSRLLLIVVVILLCCQSRWTAVAATSKTASVSWCSRYADSAPSWRPRHVTESRHLLPTQACSSDHSDRRATTRHSLLRCKHASSLLRDARRVMAATRIGIICRPCVSCRCSCVHVLHVHEHVRGNCTCVFIGTYALCMCQALCLQTVTMTIQ